MAADTKTLIITYIFSISAIMIIVTRLLWRYKRGERLQIEDKWMGAAAFPLLVRLGVQHIVLEFGTNKIHDLEGMSKRDIEKMVIGSKLILFSRVTTISFLWILKICMLGFYMRIQGATAPYNTIINACRFLVGLTYVIVILVTFLECRPFHKYWEIVPNPGDHCTHAISQLFAMGVCNVVTDIALILIPLPPILRSRLPMSRKIGLASLFSIGVFVVAITIIRTPILHDKRQSQEQRTTWITIECFAACFVANAPIFYGFTRKSKVPRTQPTPEHGPEILYHARRDSMDSVEELQRETAACGGFVIEMKTEITQDFSVLGSGDYHGSYIRPKVETKAWTEPRNHSSSTLDIRRCSIG